MYGVFMRNMISVFQLVGMLRGFWEGTYADLIINLERRNEVMYALHANYLSGNEKKAKALDKHGLWLATESTKGCYYYDIARIRSILLRTSILHVCSFVTL